MRKVLLLLAAVVVAAPACAEWTRLGSTENSVFYFDPTTIKRSGQTSRVWVMRDKKQQTFNSLSERILDQIDCADERYRTLQTTSFVGQMGTGSVTSTDETAMEWSYIAPKTMIHSLMKQICK